MIINNIKKKIAFGTIADDNTSQPAGHTRTDTVEDDDKNVFSFERLALTGQTQ